MLWLLMSVMMRMFNGLKFATLLARTPENPKPEAQNHEKHQASYQHASKNKALGFLK